MGYGLMGYNDSRRPSAKAIAEENEHMQRRHQQFRVAADYVAAEFAKVPEVRKVALFGSVAAPLFEEVPRFRRYRIHQVAILHECKDVDIAVWLNDLSCLRALQKARGQAVNRLFTEHEIGIAHHQVDVFIIDPATDKYIGNLCIFGTCPKGKEDCWVEGCGQTPFLKVYEGFKFRKDALSAEKSVVLFDRNKSAVSEPQPPGDAGTLPIEKAEQTMLRIMQKQIDLEKSPLLLSESFNNNYSLKDQWIVYGGEWWIEDGWLTGKNPVNGPGMVVSQRDFPGNVFLDFEARTVLPSTHDIDVMWNGCWDEEKNERGTAYVAGVQGWWDGKAGLEKSPDYKLTACTPLFKFTPGNIYHIQCGSIDGHCFIYIDGKLILEMRDPDPIDSQKYTKIGFEAYASFIQIRNLQVRQISWTPVDEHYDPEF